MELKSYQKKVIKQLNHFLEILADTENIREAYNKYWNEQSVPIGEKGVRPYSDNIRNTPHVCFKVPTGGGKTYLGCSSIKPIFDAMPFSKTKAVVWLVPSNSILEQTVNTLKDIDHPYRQRIERDFNGRVEVYTKDQLLNGQNFNPTTVNEQLSIFILSYDTLRSRKKEDRKIYQENGNLSQFTKFYNTPETLIKGVDDTALIQVLNQLSPVVIVDESHNATSELSVEMLVNLNPSFVLDLTATPKENSNIISFVDAIELKKENMVKLPVIVYNRQNQRDVLLDAIDLRKRLEIQAIEEEMETKRYIRPIVLFQAQPKGNEDNKTFEKLKEELVEIGIPREHIAIKTSEVNELKGINLLSPDCPIRYIITVNALKEGWDCPFAYVLATLVNRTSKVDVEQILGRVLRQPYAKKYNNPFLNMSYVLTSSNDFRSTLDNIVFGLNRAGFSKYDYRVAEENDEEINPEEVRQEQTDMFTFGVTQYENSVDSTNIKGHESFLPYETIDESDDRHEDYLEVNFEEVKKLLEERKSTEEVSGEKKANNNVDLMFASAISKSEEYSKTVEEVENNDEDFQPIEIRSKMKIFPMSEKFKTEVQNLMLPQFFIKTEPNLFIEEDTTLLTKERLAEGFTLRDKDTNIDFETLNDDLVKIDIEGSEEGIPKYTKLTRSESIYFKEYFSKLSMENKIKKCKEIIYNQINKMDTIDDTDLRLYIDRVVENMTKEQIDNLEKFVHSYADKIKQKIAALQEIYLEQNFETLLEQGSITCRESFSFKNEISPIKTISTIPRSLYQEEADLNNFEYKVINEMIATGNVKWWHKIIERKGFYINGFLYHYPDFVVMTESGRIVIVETKGDYLENSESRSKVRLGRAWQHNAGSLYRYYMVFEKKELNLEGAYHFETFIDLFKKL